MIKIYFFLIKQIISLKDIDFLINLSILEFFPSKAEYCNQGGHTILSGGSNNIKAYQVDLMPKSIFMGDAIHIKQDYKEKLYLSIIPTAISSHWEKVSDVANFVAEFYNHDFQDHSIQNNISTILNELVENAVKFSHIQNRHIDIYTFSDGDELIFQVTNSISEKSWNNLEKIHNEMETTDLKTLYLERINNLAMDKAGTGIGLILLKKDYRVDINFSLAEKEKNDYLLTTTAKMKVA